MNNILRLRRKYAGFVFLLLLVFQCRNSMASIDFIASENVQIRGDHISVQAKGITLGKLLKEIKKEAKIGFKSSKDLLEQKLSVGFKEGRHKEVNLFNELHHYE